MSDSEVRSGVEGKVIAITGASSGIGEAAARLLAARGAVLVLGARRERRLRQLCDEIVRGGGAASFLTTDVRRRDDLVALVQLACDRHGRLDVLINNAGVSSTSRLDELDVDAWEAVVDVNVKGVLYGIAAALPIFRRQGFGHFIFTLSTAGLRIVPGMAVYAGSKNAARAIAEGLRQEAGPHLRVTTISPGFVKTELASSIRDPEQRSHVERTMEEIGLPASAVARAMAYAIEQPPDVDVGEIVIRPTAQG